MLPRTAPVLGNKNLNKKSRKNYENMTSFQLTSSASNNNSVDNINANTNSNILNKRKKKSLRV